MCRCAVPSRRPPHTSNSVTPWWSEEIRRNPSYCTSRQKPRVKCDGNLALLHSSDRLTDNKITAMLSVTGFVSYLSRRRKHTEGIGGILCVFLIFPTCCNTQPADGNKQSWASDTVLFIMLSCYTRLLCYHIASLSLTLTVGLS